MRSREPMVICDGDDGLCGAETRDFYASHVSSVGDVQITTKVRAPGWFSVKGYDWCPEHNPRTRPGVTTGGESDG